MSVDDLQQTYRRLHEQLLRGELDEEDFKAEVERLHFRDDLGNQWKIGWYTGKWYRLEQRRWIQDQPPAQVAGAPPLAATGSSPVTEAKPKRRSRAAYLAFGLIGLLLLASVGLVAGWSAGWWGEANSAATSTALAGADASALAAAGTGAATLTPEVMPSPVTQTPGASAATSASPTIMARATATASRTPVATVTRRSPSATPTQHAGTAEPTETNVPTPAATAVQTSSPAPTSRPLPTATPALSGQILFPVYDPNPDRRTFDIYSVQLESGQREIVVGQASQPALSPSGKRLAYRSWSSDQRGILVRELTNGDVWRWVGYHEAEQPSWSPDNQNIVFSSQQESDRRWRLYRTWGPDIDKVRREGGDVFGRVPAWSADGRIVFWECPVDKCGLYAIRADGTNQQRLTVKEQDTAPATSPDGQQVAFMSNLGGNWEIFVTSSHSQGGQGDPDPRRLTTNGARDGLPTWSPNGQWLAFVTDRDGTWAIWVMRPDGSEQQGLFNLGGPLEGEVGQIPPSEQHGWTWESIAWGE